MLIRIISSCTGEKTVTHDRPLTLADFEKGPTHVGSREAELQESLTPAVDLYGGLQHQRLMRGVRAVQSDTAHAFSVDLWILSAGYGLIPGDRRIAPYEATFAGMGSARKKTWARQLDLHSATQSLFAKPADIIFVLLGDDYLDACGLDATLRFGGECLLFCGAHAAKRLPDLPRLHKVELGNTHAKQFSCGLVGLKGELVARFLEGLLSGRFTQQDIEASRNPLDLLAQSAVPTAARRPSARPNPKVDRVVDIPDGWWGKSHREKLMYFIPEWDDLVDADFDFQSDTHSGGSGDWSNEVYAHQMYNEPNYDGILISRVVAEKSKKKKERIYRLGVHRFLRVPRKFPIMGDCGAFGYIHKQVPPYTTAEIIEYYTALDFDFGVSIDHLIVAATESERKGRYELTVNNAFEFIKQHHRAKLSWTPIGAVQGWDANSYAAAARQYVAMGYEYIALGGLVRSPTSEILKILDKVHEVVPANVKIHLFGLARLAAMTAFASLGVRSVDSASYLRRAWMGSGGQNYLTMTGDFFTAIRVPEVGRSFRAKRMVSEKRASQSEILRLERACLLGLRDFDRGRTNVDSVLNILEDYDQLITPDRRPHRERLKRTLEARPWKDCPCDICRRDGIETIIFRGNNRNRRRGFHNTYVFYRLLQKVLAGECVREADHSEQSSLFEEEDCLAEISDAV